MESGADTTSIRFTFEPEKALQAMAYMVGRLDGVDKVALTKLLYIADRDHFLNHGHPITGDRQYALPKGPVPSDSLHLLDGEFWFLGHDPSEFIHQTDHRLTLRCDPGTDRLTPQELATLDEVIKRYRPMLAQPGDRGTWQLVNETHEFPEYKAVFRDGTSTLIPYELILQCHAGERGYRHNRPVISQAIAAHMVSPFSTSVDDL